MSTGRQSSPSVCGGWLVVWGWGGVRSVIRKTSMQLDSNVCERPPIVLRGCAYANVAFLLILIRREIKPLTIKRFLLTNSLKQEISLYKLSSISYLKFLS